MLIVNADDFGASTSATDAAISVFEEGAISSCSAMVWMQDSRRAAALAHERGVPTGLHLNLTLPFDAPHVPSVTRERQLEFTRCFTSGDRAGPIHDRELRRSLAEAIQDQLRQFELLFGRPTHLDGHHHIQVHPAVSALLPAGVPVRLFLKKPSQSSARRGREERKLRRKLRAPSLTLALEDLHPALGGVGLELLDRAWFESVEVMTHPQQRRQLEALRSPEWRELVTRLPVGSFSGLDRRRSLRLLQPKRTW